LSFPLLLFAFGFFHDRELRRIAEVWQKLAVELRRRRLNESWLLVVGSVGVILLLGCLMLLAGSRRG
jgi:hypothetical protein